MDLLFQTVSAVIIVMLGELHPFYVHNKVRVQLRMPVCIHEIFNLCFQLFLDSRLHIFHNIQSLSDQAPKKTSFRHCSNEPQHMTHNHTM